MVRKKDAAVHLEASSLGWSPSESHLLGAVGEEGERHKTPPADRDFLPAVSLQTTNSITMLGQQNFTAPSPGRLKIHQKC